MILADFFATRIRFIKRIRLDELKRIQTDPDPKHCFRPITRKKPEYADFWFFVSQNLIQRHLTCLLFWFCNAFKNWSFLAFVAIKSQAVIFSRRVSVKSNL